MIIYINRKTTGASLTQYAIIIALIALLVVPGFFLIGTNITGSFENLYNGLLGNSRNSSESISDNKSITPDKIVDYDQVFKDEKTNVSSKCSGDFCTLEVGDIILKDVPVNIADIIETGGSSAATDKLASLIEQIAEQAKVNPAINSQDKEKIAKLAELAYKMAEKEKYLEGFSEKALELYLSCSESYKKDLDESMKTSEIKKDYYEEKFAPYIEYLEKEAKMYDENIYNISDQAAAKLLSNSKIDTSGSSLREDFDNLLGDLTTSTTSSLDKQLKSLLNTLGSDVQTLATNMYDASLTGNSTFTQESGVDSSSTSNTSYINAADSLNSLSTANDGLTSDFTNLDAKLIEATIKEIK